MTLRCVRTEDTKARVTVDLVICRLIVVNPSLDFGLFRSTSIMLSSSPVMM